MKGSALVLTLFLVVPLNSDPIRCQHGEMGYDGCECEENYYGIYCQTQFNCNNTGNPARGQRCDTCKPNWSGDYCDIILCGEHGTRSIEFPQTCTCDAPFTGQFCTALNTSDVYRFYNKRLSSYIPLGILIIIPASILILVCDFLSRRRHTMRVDEAVMTSYLKDADSDAVESMKLNQSGNSSL